MKKINKFLFVFLIIGLVLISIFAFPKISTADYGIWCDTAPYCVADPGPNEFVCGESQEWCFGSNPTCPLSGSSILCGQFVGCASEVCDPGPVCTTPAILGVNGASATDPEHSGVKMTDTAIVVYSTASNPFSASGNDLKLDNVSISTFYNGSGQINAYISPLSAGSHKVMVTNACGIPSAEFPFVVPNITYTLTVSKAGTGSGTVTGAGTYNSGTVVPITASASSNSTFTGWSGDSDCTDYSVTMNANKTCTATFTLIPAPTTPTGYSASASSCGNAWLNLSWNTSSGVGPITYNVYRDGGGSPITLSSYSCTSSVCTGSDTGVALGTNHSYQVDATNIGGTSPRTPSFGNTVASACLPPTVTSPTATSITASTATLGANVTSAGSGNITARGTCWGTSPSPSGNCSAEGGTSTGIFTHSRSGFSSGITYYYRGYASNIYGTGYSPDGTFKTLSAPPTGISATPGACSTGSISLSWTGSTGADSYDIYRSTTSGSGYSLIANDLSSPYVSSGLTAGVTYYYVIQARNTTGPSVNSSQVSAVAPAVCPTPIVGLCSSTHYSCITGSSINPSDNLSTWTWVCEGSGGGASANCSENKPAPTASLSASPTSVAYNGRTTLTWSSTNATSCTAPSGNWSNSGTLAGSGLTDPLTFNTTFTFQCSGNGQTSPLQSVTVSVAGAPVNGACSVPPTHYTCSAGDLGGTAEYGDQWQWWCNGIDGGTSILCAEMKSDLSAGAVTPIVAPAGTATTFSATITNNSTASTRTSFTTLFQTSPSSTGASGVVNYEVAGTPAIAGNSSAVVSKSITFSGPTSPMYVRVCADNNSSFVGTISESNEGNNCGAWTLVSVIPPPPMGVARSCNASSDLMTISWTLPAGYTDAFFRSNVGANNYTTPATVVVNSGITTSYSMAVVPNQTYTMWVRTKAMDGTASDPIYYNNFSCSASLPTVTSPTISFTNSTSATLGANVTAAGSSALTARGTCWGTSPNPAGNCLAEGGTSTGVFTQARSGISGGTQIFYSRGYATNSSGTGYSADNYCYICAGPTGLLPSGNVTGATVNLSWQTVPNATSYNLRMVNNVGGSSYDDPRFAGSCGAYYCENGILPSTYCSGTTCTVPNVPVVNGNYTFWIDPGYPAPYNCLYCNGAVGFSVVPAATPVVTGVTISPKPICISSTPTSATIVVTATDGNGGADIASQYAMINFQGANAGAYRGYVGWSIQGFPYTIEKSTPIACTGGGTAKEILGSDSKDYGSAYINLISCSTSVSGNTRTTSFVVNFDPLFITPTANNTISTWVSDAGGLYDGFDPFDIFGLNFKFTLTVDPVGSGSITTSPVLSGGCGLGWTGITAVPNAGYQFQNWTGDTGSTNNPEATLLDRPRTVTAHFSPVALTKELTAGAITPTTAIVGTPQTFSASITNSGTGSTETSFYNLFQVATVADGTGATAISANQLSALGAGISNSVSSSPYTFSSAGTYYVRACADNNASWVGTITETNEGNNCGAWTPVVVSPVVLAIDAECISINAPSPVTRGQIFSATVIMKNIGLNTWSEASWYRLGSQNTQDNTRWGFGRVYLPAGVTVPKDSNYSFVFNATAPTTMSTAGCTDLGGGNYSCPFDWAMVHDGDAWFGETCTNTITVIPPNNAPGAPVITGSNTVVLGTPYTYHFVSTDPDGNQVKIAIDWDNNGSVDEWQPSSGYVASSADQASAYSWSSTGAKTFRAYAVDDQGATSGWSSFDLNVSSPTGSITVTRTYGGYVTSDVGGINCGTMCSQTYAQGTVVNLTPTPDSGQWRFSGWQGGCPGTLVGNICRVTVGTTNVTLTPMFSLRPLIYQEF